MNGIIPQGRALDPESLKRLPVRGRAAGYETMLSRHSLGNTRRYFSRYVWESGFPGRYPFMFFHHGEQYK